MQGMALVADLATRKNVDCAIMVMSGNLANADLVDAIKMGAGAGIQKPFARASVIPTIRHLAEVARRRRLYKARENAGLMEPDSSRFQRPVFLSYSSKDDVLANGLRRNIEARGIPVWYAPTTVPPGDPWRARVEAGIDSAKIFVALLTSNDIVSPHCPREFKQFQTRVDRATEPKPLILPVLAELSNRAKRSDLYQHIDRYQRIEISSGFIDGLTELLLRIESFLAQISGSEKCRPTPAVTISDKVLSFPPHSEKSFS